MDSNKPDPGNAQRFENSPRSSQQRLPKNMERNLKTCPQSTCESHNIQRNCLQPVKVHPSTLMLQESQIVTKNLAFWEQKAQREIKNCGRNHDDFTEQEITRFAYERFKNKTNCSNGLQPPSIAKEAEVQTEDVVVIQKYVSVTTSSEPKHINSCEKGNPILSPTTANEYEEQFKISEKKSFDMTPLFPESGSYKTSSYPSEVENKLCDSTDITKPTNICKEHTINPNADIIRNCIQSQNTQDSDKKENTTCSCKRRTMFPEVSTDTAFNFPSQIPKIDICPEENDNETVQQCQADSISPDDNKTVVVNDTDLSSLNVQKDSTKVSDYVENNEETQEAIFHDKMRHLKEMVGCNSDRFQGKGSDSSFLSCEGKSYKIIHGDDDKIIRSKYTKKQRSTDDEKILQKLSLEFNSLVTEKNVMSHYVISNTSTTVFSSSNTDVTRKLSSCKKVSRKSEKESFRVNTNICKKCMQPIIQSSYTLAGGFLWHKEHFTCSFCKVPLVNTNYALEDYSNSLSDGKTESKVFCFPCHKKLFVRICQACGKQISTLEPYVETQTGQVWHSNKCCLKCVNCHHSLVGISKFYRKGKFIYCNKFCAQKRGLPEWHLPLSCI